MNSHSLYLCDLHFKLMEKVRNYCMCECDLCVFIFFICFSNYFNLRLSSWKLILLKNIIFATRNSGFQAQNEQAFYLAEAGLNKAEWFLLNTAPNGSTNQTWRTNAYSGGTPNSTASACSGTTPCAESLAGGSYTMWVETSAPNIMITSCGLYSGISRTVQVKIYFPSNYYNAYPVAGSWRELKGVTKGACP